jgi:hypothetical protein
MKDEILKKRARLYSKIRENCNLERDDGIYFDIKLSDDDYNNLKIAVTNYIAKTLRVSHPAEDFSIDNDFLVKYEKQILNLPNRTPNGAFHPKKENIVEYNELQRSIVKALKNIGIIENFLAVQPCTVRVVSGKSADLDHTRPLATTKLHSDAWASHVGDAILGVALIGDPSTKLEFNKPEAVSDDFFLPLTNYDEGLKKFKDKRFLGSARLGYVNVFDHACLHRTSLNEGGIRVSFDFGVITDNPDSLYYDAMKRKKKHLEEYRYEYLDKNVYCKLGETLFIEVEETLSEAEQRYSNPKLRDAKLYERAAIKIVEHLQDGVKND